MKKYIESVIAWTDSLNWKKYLHKSYQRVKLVIDDMKNT